MSVCLITAAYVASAILELLGIGIIVHYLRSDRARAIGAADRVSSARPYIGRAPVVGRRGTAVSQPDRRFEDVARSAMRADASFALAWTSGKRAWAPFLIAAGVLVAVAANIAALHA